MKKLILGIALTLVASTAAAATVAGVNIPETSDVNGQQLVLNGAGLRKKFVVKVYTGALYLSSKQSNAGAILASDAPRQMVMHFLYDVDRGKMAEAWEEGLAANVPSAGAEVRGAFRTLSSWMQDMKSGQQLVMSYTPGSGTTVTVAGTVKGTLPGKAVNDAILATWIGPKPGPGNDFRKAVLGQ
jgi:hypothetical protein